MSGNCNTNPQLQSNTTDIKTSFGTVPVLATPDWVALTGNAFSFDLQVFRERPTLTRFIRRGFACDLEGEVYTIPETIETWTLVTQTVPGIRNRVPFPRPAGKPFQASDAAEVERCCALAEKGTQETAALLATLEAGLNHQWRRIQGL